MEKIAFIAIIFAALLHAIWNLILKSSEDKAVAMITILFTSLPLAIISLYLGGFPIPATLPIIVVSSCVQTAYCITLLKAYDKGQLSSIYPVSRGISPLFVAATVFLFSGTSLSTSVLAGILLSSLGLIIFGLVRSKTNMSSKSELSFAITNGVLIAIYSMTDAYATKLVGNALSFFGTMALFNRTFLLLYLILFEKSFISRMIENFKVSFIIGGIVSFICYLIVLWSYQFLSVPVVSALREVSVIFAVIFGVFFLREDMRWEKLLMITLTLIGVSLITDVL